jgi:hypothetical protein
MKMQTNIMGGYSDLNRELTVPHTVVLPIELYPPFVLRGEELNIIVNRISSVKSIFKHLLNNIII